MSKSDLPIDILGILISISPTKNAIRYEHAVHEIFRTAVSQPRYIANLYFSVLLIRLIISMNALFKGCGWKYLDCLQLEWDPASNRSDRSDRFFWTGPSDLQPLDYDQSEPMEYVNFVAMLTSLLAAFDAGLLPNVKRLRIICPRLTDRGPYSRMPHLIGDLVKRLGAQLEECEFNYSQALPPITPHLNPSKLKKMHIMAKMSLVLEFMAAQSSSWSVLETLSLRQFDTRVQSPNAFPKLKELIILEPCVNAPGILSSECETINSLPSLSKLQLGEFSKEPRDWSSQHRRFCRDIMEERLTKVAPILRLYGLPVWTIFLGDADATARAFEACYDRTDSKELSEICMCIRRYVRYYHNVNPQRDEILALEALFSKFFELQKDTVSESVLFDTMVSLCWLLHAHIVAANDNGQRELFWRQRVLSFGATTDVTIFLLISEREGNRFDSQRGTWIEALFWSGGPQHPLIMAAVRLLQEHGDFCLWTTSMNLTIADDVAFDNPKWLLKNIGWHLDRKDVDFTIVNRLLKIACSRGHRGAYPARYVYLSAQLEPFPKVWNEDAPLEPAELLDEVKQEVFSQMFCVFVDYYTCVSYRTAEQSYRVTGSFALLAGVTQEYRDSFEKLSPGSVLAMEIHISDKVWECILRGSVPKNEDFEHAMRAAVAAVGPPPAVSIFGDILIIDESKLQEHAVLFKYEVERALLMRKTWRLLQVNM